MTEPTSTPTSADLSVKFQEPTVAGLTGEQWYQLRLWEEEQRCEYEVYPLSPKGPAERCLEPKAENSSRFCEEHISEWLWEQTESTYDDYDCWVDRSFE